MRITQQELDSFHRFASDKLTNGSGEHSLEELVSQWRADRERADVNQAIREAIHEMNAGLGQPIDEAMEELRRKYNIAAE